MTHKTEYSKHPRYQCIIGKAQVLNITPGPFGKLTVVTQVVSTETQMKLEVPTTSDVRVGDLLTIYTEVLARKPN